MSAFELFDKGGTVMWILLLVSAYTLGVIFYKLYQFYAARIWLVGSEQKLMDVLRQGEAARVQQALAKRQDPMAKVMLASMACAGSAELSEKYKEAEISRLGTAYIHRLESHMRGLEIAAAVAPLLGLLGTVIGLIDSFSKLGIGTSRVDPTMLAGGIWEALLTTAAGLIVAIPALAAHAGFDSLIDRFKIRMQDAAVQILSIYAAKPSGTNRDNDLELLRA